METSIINEIIGPVIVAILVLYGFVSFWFNVYSKLKKKYKGGFRDGGIVPNMREIPKPPNTFLDGSVYRRIPPTIETTYGQNLLRVSIKVFLKNLDDGIMNPEDMAQCSVLSAVNLLADVGKVCFERDMEKAEKSSDDAIKAFQKLGETGIK